MTTSPTDPVDLVLHIGSGKTGTSSIQRFLHLNRARLADLGCLYPKSPGLLRHLRLSLYIRPDHLLDSYPSWADQNSPSPEVFRRQFRRRLLKEINRSGMSKVLLSDEGLYGSPDEALPRLNRLLGRVRGSLRLVVYLRRQDDHLASRYQQVVKAGATRRLVERVQLSDLSKTYDYYTRLRLWERSLTPDEFVVRRFEPDSFVRGSLYEDFLEAAGIDAQAHAMQRVSNRNESLDADSVEFLRLWNVYRVENEGAKQGFINNRILVQKLAKVSAGPKLTMPGDLLHEFMSQWEESNRRVAIEILGDESGQLFRTPRQTANTTTEQRLDPERLDHFLDLLQLPAHVHAPLRELVEREASRL